MRLIRPTKQPVGPVSVSATGRLAGWQRNVPYPANKMARRPGKR
ncbi:hypothetical protein HMPREF0208_00778 [Citrobacter koseri]|nr:hypothetical protein HMPREF3207_00949 [Citrobacter koseri]KXB46271.1 hypothetical protein HMPREF0208_00778 [Citrobacter koseri]